MKTRASKTEGKRPVRQCNCICLVMMAATILCMAGYGPHETAAQTQTPIRIGNVGTMSGPLGAAGQAGTRSVQLYIDDLNKSGGLLGRPMEMLSRDDEGSPAGAIKAMRELHDRYGVNFFLNLPSSAASIAAVPVLQELGALAIVGAVSDQLVGSKGGPNVFRVSGGSYLQNRAFVDIIREKYPNVKKWAHIDQDYSFGRDNWAAFLRRFKEVDPKFQVVAEQWPKLGAGGGYGPHISAVLDAKPEGLYTSMIGSDWPAFGREAKRYGLFDKVRFVHADITFAETSALGVDTPECWAWTQYAAVAANNASSRWLQKAYSDRHGAKEWAMYEQFAAVPYDQIKAYHAAILKAGTTDVEAVRRALEGVRFEGARGEIWMRPGSHQAMGPLIFIHIAPDAKSLTGFKVDQWIIKNSADYALPVEEEKKL